MECRFGDFVAIINELKTVIITKGNWLPMKTLRRACVAIVYAMSCGALSLLDIAGFRS